jgi:GTP-binding protein
MIDTVRLNIHAGNGGNGCVSFLRLKYNPRGGPDGGDGGSGGSAYIQADPSLNTLLHLKYNSTIYAAAGVHGKGKTQRGRDGQPVTVSVPLGTQVFLRARGGAHTLLADVVDISPHLVARGGRGGWGNAHYVSSTNREPMLAQRGERGEKVVLFLELKLLADVGLLARPNAGKSTLLSRCSAAKPKVADYPFTTVEPALGVVARHGREFVMMEVPGLLEGAHRGVGLGQQFLRHAERTKIYVHVIDGLSEDPVADFNMLNEELRQFGGTLNKKRQIVAVNKLDVTEVRDRRDDIQVQLMEAVDGQAGGPDSPWDENVLFISAATGEGVEHLLDRVSELLSLTASDAGATAVRPVAPVQARRGKGVERVYRDGDVYVVESEDLERLAAAADTRDQRVILQLWREMTRRGLARRLVEEGIDVGETIRIGSVEVEWF